MNREIICFDFDHTLAIEEVSGGWIAVGTGALKPVQKIVDMVLEKDKEGFDCHIVTFRKEEDILEVEEFVKMHNLPIKGIHSTSGKSKIPILKKLNCTLMIDDQVEVCTACIMNDIPCLLVDHGFSGTNNVVADRMDKIKV
jgi:uncharacterized HAD superfamily protein